MKVFVHAKPGARKESVDEIDRAHFVIAVRAAAKENEANKAIIRALSRHFNIAQSRVNLLSGLRGKRKVFEIK